MSRQASTIMLCARKEFLAEGAIARALLARPPAVSDEDLWSIFIDAMERFERAYNPVRGEQSTYAGYCVKSAVAEFHRRRGRSVIAASARLLDIPAPEPPDIDKERIQRAIASLPKAQAEAVRLRFWEYASYAEIARAQGRSVKAVRDSVYRAYTSLRGLLAP